MEQLHQRRSRLVSTENLEENDLLVNSLLLQEWIPLAVQPKDDIGGSLHYSGDSESEKEEKTKT